MPKMVCVECETELRPYKNETLVIETASFGPYKVWFADTWICPGCNYKVVSGFGQNPVRADHYAEDFPAWLEHIKSVYPYIVMDNEKPRK